MKAEDSTRRDAIARGLAARLQDGRLDLEALLVLDAVVAQLVDTKPPRDHYNEDEGNDEQQAYRRGWNHGYRHREGMERTTKALAELQEMDLRVKSALVRGE